MSSFVVRSQPQFLAKLDAETCRLQTVLPAGTRHWGSARKALNLFLRDALNVVTHIFNKYRDHGLG